MQQDKNKKNSQESRRGKDELSLNLIKTFELFSIKRITMFFNKTKRCGIKVSTIIPVLLLLPFYGLSSISDLFVNGLSKLNPVSRGKNAYYDLKNNERICWRSLLYLIVRRFIYLIKKSDIVDLSLVKVFIFDDTVLRKLGKKIENVSLVNDHSSSVRYVFGFKLLVMGYLDGQHFIPIDFSLHREKGHRVKDQKDKICLVRKRLKKNKRLYRQLKKYRK